MSSVRLVVNNSLLDTADTGTITSDGELDVALVTPVGVPGVSDEPVLEAGGGVVTVSDGGDGVIEAGTASSGVKDTASVSLPGGSFSIDQDGKNLVVESGLHLRDAVGLDGIDLVDLNGGGAALVVLACLGGGRRSRGVGVG